MCSRALMRVHRCARVRSYSSGRDSRVTYVTFASIGCVRHSLCVRVCLCVCVFVCAHPLHQRGLCMAADSLSPEDISQKGRRRSRSNPEGCSFSQPSGSLNSLLPSPSSLALSPLPRLGSKAKASPLLHLRRERPCNSNERPSLFPFILVPVSGER